MGWGGARIGSGRKPKAHGSAVLHGAKRTMSARRRRVRTAGETPPPPVSPPVVAATVEAPAGLPEAQRAIWELLAPHAIAAKTLTPGTALAFWGLCEAVVVRDQMKAALDAEGLTSGSPAVAKWQIQARLVGTMLLSFRLAPMGKEIEQPEQPKDDWAEFDAGPQLVKGARV